MDLIFGFGAQELLVLMVIIVPFLIMPIVSYWKIFEKAEQPGWAAIIPVYNVYIMTKIAGKPAWWTVLCCIPYVGLIWLIWTTNLLVKSFGKTEAFTIGVILLPFIFLPILAFGDNIYRRNL